MKSLIVFYSHTGNNAKLAYELSKRMKCDIHKIMVEKKRTTFSILLDRYLKRKSKLSIYNLNLSEYKNVIFIAPIWGGQLAGPIREFIEAEKNNLNRYFFISICNGVKSQKEKLISELSSIVHKEPVEVTELWINAFLPDNRKNKIRYTFNFRVSMQELQQCKHEIDSFISRVTMDSPVT
ncbi:flavodoxin family protein [Bacillus tuaregi]|uniref:flavodoxin family protein n=1 Tax=Bacillus tuaregi TaxID=1816695 RepID=UPI0008F97724|nr:flavodoxin domain-containing protein [Bacillus tuaregi]